MNIGSLKYDPDLQMFVEQPRELDTTRLKFFRWLSKHGRLDCPSAGESSGDNALTPSREMNAELLVGGSAERRL